MPREWPGPLNWPQARALEDERQALLSATAQVEAFLDTNQEISNADPENIKTVTRTLTGHTHPMEFALRTSDLRLLVEAVKRDSL